MVTTRYNHRMNVEVLEELIEFKVAPTPLIMVQGLVNTFSWDDQVELMGDAEESRAWLVSADLLAADASVSPAEHETLIALREAVREMLESNHTGEPAPEATKTLAELSARHPVAYEVKDDGEIGLSLEPAPDVDALIGQTLGVIHQAQNLDQWSRLNICAAEDCRWAFYDASKNRSGTWCKMEICGNRTKNRRYRTKS